MDLTLRAAKCKKSMPLEIPPLKKEFLKSSISAYTVYTHGPE